VSQARSFKIIFMFKPVFIFYLRMRWAGHTARIGERRGVYRVLMGNPEGKNHLREPGVDGRIILR